MVGCGFYVCAIQGFGVLYMWYDVNSEKGLLVSFTGYNGLASILVSFTGYDG